jgi:hypothetical protein
MKILYFCLNIFSLFVSNIFEKSYDTFLGFLVETIRKYFENFPHFWFKIFKLIFWNH